MPAPNYLEEAAKIRQTYGQRVAEYPQTVEKIRGQIYGGDTVLPTLRGTRDEAISQLWDVDKRLAERYANPQSEMFIRDPYKREQLAAGQHQSVLGTVSGTERLVQAREDMLGNLLDKTLDTLKLSLSALPTQHGMVLDELTASLKGGAGTSTLDPLALLSLLGLKQKQQTQEEAPLTGAEAFRARVLSGAGNVPAPTYEPNLGERIKDRLSISNLGAIFGITPTPRRSQVTYPDVEITPEAKQKVLSARPAVPEAEPLDYQNLISALSSGDYTSLLAGMGGAEGMDATNLALLQYITGASPTFANKVAEKMVMEQLFPSTSTGYTEQQEREAAADLADDLSSVVEDAEGRIVDANGTEKAASVQDLYAMLVRTYPEMSSKDILDLMEVYGFVTAGGF